MTKAEYVPAIGEQLSNGWMRNLSYKDFDLRFFSDKSFFKHNVALQCAFYGITGATQDKDYRETISYPKTQSLYFDSVDYTETIIIRETGKKSFKNIEIGKFVDTYLNVDHNKSLLGHEYKDINNWEVLTIDNDFKVSWKKINKVIRHKINKKCLRIQTIGGKNICITPNHSILQFKDINTLQTREIKDLKKNDYVISYDKVNFNEEDIEYFDFNVKYFNENVPFRFFIDDLELECMGYYTGNGNKSNTSINISGAHYINVKKLFLKLCKKYNINMGVAGNKIDSYISSTKLVQVFKFLELNGDCYNKYIPFR